MVANVNLVKDSEWVRRSFLVKKGDLDATDYRNRIFSSASLKYTDTTPGGNIAINPPAQFTRFADPKCDSQFKGSAGMGRYYSEAIDDHSQVIHMRFGTEQFNSITTFFTGFYNSSAGQLARTGRGDGMFYLLGKAVGYVVQLASWKLLAVHFLGVAIKFLAQKPTSKFYYSKPAMPLYWNAVTTIVNHLSVNRGIIPRIFGDDGKKLDADYEFSPDQLKNMHEKGPPDIFKENGGIDVYAIANKAKRLERKRMEQVKTILDNHASLSTLELTDVIREIYGSPSSLLSDDKVPELNNNSETNPGYLQRWFATDQAKTKPAGDEKTGNNESANTTESLEENKSGLNKLEEFLQAEWDDGSAFASFRVNSTGPVENSFTNNVGESELSSKINGISSQARSANFSLANGNLIGGAAGAIVGGALNAVKNFTTGVLDSVELTGLATLAGAAFVDIPKYWQSSMASLPRASYTINLVSPYGNPLSQLLNLDIPLAMLLAGALPKSTGKQSHVGPFLVELYDRGRCQTRLGMIDSLSITRGVGNVGFNQAGKALGIDVTFTVVDMSSVMHMPITESFTFLEAAAQAAGQAVAGSTGQAVAAAVTGAGAFDDDTVFSDYMAVLAGMALNDQIYPMRKLKLNLTRAMANYDSWASVSHLSSFLGDTFPSHMISAFYRGTDRR